MASTLPGFYRRCLKAASKFPIYNDKVTRNVVIGFRTPRSIPSSRALQETALITEFLEHMVTLPRAQLAPLFRKGWVDERTGAILQLSKSQLES